MEGFEGGMEAGVDTGTESLDTGAETEALETGAEEGVENEGTEEGTEGSEESEAPAKSLKQTVKELGDADMDAIVKVKVGNQTKTMTVREALKRAAAEEEHPNRVEQATRRQVQAMVEFAKSNPREFFKQVGIDPYDFAESTLAEKLEEMNMTPEQREIRDLKAKAQKYEEQERVAKERAEQEKVSTEERHAMESLDKELTQAFQESGLPKHPFYIQQIAAAMLAADNQGEELSAKDAAALIKGRFTTQTKEIFESMDAAQLREYLGESVLKKLRQADVARVTGKSAPTLDSGTRSASKPAPAPAKKAEAEIVNEKGWREYLQGLKTAR